MSSAVIRIQVGSENPVKHGAAIKAFSRAFPGHAIRCDMVKAPSNVPDQPMSEADTKLGAQNRVTYCAHQDKKQKFQYYVAMEGGVDLFDEGPATFAYVAIRDSNGALVTGRSANLPLPRTIFNRLEQGEELADVMDDVFNQHNIRQKGGAIGVFTNHLETRESVYMQALILALAPFLHSEFYA
ncbi:non-canonical purine NTP phosphatase [Marinomonas piezotolerans]|uniref:Inosine/xanthosine triphosphatase n=1 Tax=Marinomonas piezotolerans TaxID=2213058 RepID=A0A370UE30_9GAMM|nr:inosine/xanthosine triphosphatase [Marinomonas piezotolerans]RDL46040.1 non-canonical purine NTP phosphatase [Marinomonas piezotolerans]